MKKYETEAEERAQQINQIRVQDNAPAWCAEMGGQGDSGCEVRYVLPVYTQDCKEQLNINVLSAMAMQVDLMIQNSPVMEKLLQIPGLVVGNICPSNPASMDGIDVGKTLEYESIVDDRALLHLDYKVAAIENGCTAKLILEDFKIDRYERI